MKTFISFILFAMLFCVSSQALAQQNDPPPAAAEYSPNSWKEYAFVDENVRFRFPSEPLKEATTVGAQKFPGHGFSNAAGSFLYLRLDVTAWPDQLGSDELLKAFAGGLLKNITNDNAKLIKDEDITVDGNPGKFIQAETKDGKVLRFKLFVSGHRSYVAVVTVAKDKRHGVNWENDFEVPAMAFLDSIHSNLPKK